MIITAHGGVDISGCFIIGRDQECYVGDVEHDPQSGMFGRKSFESLLPGVAMDATINVRVCYGDKLAEMINDSDSPTSE